jgi:hypothetical protein
VAVFELGGTPAPELSELAIGPWTRAPAIAAFDAGADPLETRWRIQLAHDDSDGRAALAAGERSIERAHAVLDTAPRRFEQLLEQMLEPSRAALAPDVSYAAPPSDPEPGSIGRLLQRAGDLVRGRARIETQLEGALAARTLTTLSGDTELWLATGLPRSCVDLHVRSVAAALHTRRAWARLLVLAMTCSGRIAALGTPAGALPLVWRFLRDVLRDVRDPDTAPVR